MTKRRKIIFVTSILLCGPVVFASVMLAYGDNCDRAARAGDDDLIEVTPALPLSSVTEVDYRVTGGMVVTLAMKELPIRGQPDVAKAVFHTETPGLAFVSKDGEVLFLDTDSPVTIKVVGTQDGREAVVTFELLPDVDTSAPVEMTVEAQGNVEIRQASMEYKSDVLCVREKERIELKVTVQFADRQVRDVTGEPWTEFFSSAPYAASVCATGLVSLYRPNDGSLPIAPIRVIYKTLVQWVIIDYSEDCITTVPLQRPETPIPD